MSYVPLSECVLVAFLMPGLVAPSLRLITDALMSSTVAWGWPAVSLILIVLIRDSGSRHRSKIHVHVHVIHVDFFMLPSTSHAYPYHHCQMPPSPHHSVILTIIIEITVGVWVTLGGWRLVGKLTNGGCISRSNAVPFLINLRGILIERESGRGRGRGREGERERDAIFEQEMCYKAK